MRHEAPAGSICALICLALLGLAAPHLVAAAPSALVADSLESALVADLSDGELESFDLADAMLIASGVSEPAALALYRARLDGIVGQALSRARPGHSDSRRGRRLHAALHDLVLKRYETSAGGLTDLIDRGVYNCVSATLLYMLAAREAGLDVEAVETPFHVMAALKTPRGRIEVETTSPRGFGRRRSLREFRDFMLGGKYITREELGRRGIEEILDEFQRKTYHEGAEPVIAFLYHNQGIRALRQQRAGEAARGLINAARIYPDLAYRSEDLRNTLAWAIREAYDEGRFQDSFRLAEVGMHFFADRMTVKDRFVAVGARLIEEAAVAGDLAAAESYEARVRQRLNEPGDRRRLATLTAPMLARAAVLAQDWPAARRHATSFRDASPDPVEAERLSRWVEQRIVAEGTADAPAELAEAVAAALAAGPGAGEDPGATPESHPYRAIVRAVATLAGQGRFEEALAVGRLEMSVLEERREEDAARAGIDALLRAVAAWRIRTLIEARRWDQAEAATREALDDWPADAALLTLRHRAAVAMARDPYRLSAWPEAFLATRPAPDPDDPDTPAALPVLSGTAPKR